jgi:general secretion pathway protein J
MSARARHRTRERGFTLIETLVALALMGLVLSALANLTAQWLPNWNRGLNRIQRSELIGTALQRIADDLAAAQNVPVSGSGKQPPLFAGSERSVTFVRSAVGPNAGPGLDVVHLGETTDRAGLATVRSRMPFHPLPEGTSLSDHLHFREPVVLLRAPYRLSFAYSGEDREWKSSWQDSKQLPAKIRLTVQDGSSGRVLTLSTVAAIHVQPPARGDCKQPPNNGQPPNGQPQNAQSQNGQPQDGNCDDDAGAPANAQGNSQQSNPSAAAQSGRS